MLVDTHASVDRHDAPLSELRAEMASAGVSRAVLVQNWVDTGPEPYAQEARRKHPMQFALVVRVHPHELPTAQILKEWAHQRHFAGIQMRPGLEPKQTWLNSPKTLPLWETIRELDLPVCLLIRSHQYNQLSDIVTDFPEIRIVLDHLGQGPETQKVVPKYLPILLEYSRYTQVYVKISRLFQLSRQEHPHQDLWPALRNVYERFGPQRIIWGSDYPLVKRYCGYQREAQLIDSLAFLTSEERQWIKYKTAETLWFPSTPSHTDSPP